MSDYQDVRVVELARDRGRLTVSVSEAHPDGLCFGTLLNPDGSIRPGKQQRLAHTVALILRDANDMDNGVSDALDDADVPSARDVVASGRVLSVEQLEAGPFNKAPLRVTLEVQLVHPTMLRGIRQGARWGAAALPDGDL